MAVHATLAQLLVRTDLAEKATVRYEICLRLEEAFAFALRLIEETDDCYQVAM